MEALKDAGTRSPWRRALGWNVRNRFLVAFLIVAAIPLVAFAALTYSRTAASLRTLERQEIAAQAVGVRAVLADRVQDEHDFLRDYAVWDEFHHAARTGDRAWIRRNITAWVPANSDTAMVAVYDERGTVLDATGEDAASLWTADEVQDALRGRIEADLRAVDGRLCVLAAGPIRAQTGHARPAGTVVFAMPVDDEILRGVNRFTGGEGRLAVYVDSMPSAATDPREAGAFATFRPAEFAPGEPFSEGGFTSQMVRLDDEDEVPVALLRVSVPRASFLTALDDINEITVIAFIVALVIALGMGLVMSQTISRPLRRMAVAAGAIARGDLHQRLDMTRGDELGELATAFDTMSERVSSRVEALSQKTQTMSLEIQNLSAFGATLSQTVDAHAELRRLADMVRAMVDGDSASIYLGYDGELARAAFSGSADSPVPSQAVDELAARVAHDGIAREAVGVGAPTAPGGATSEAARQLSCLVVPLNSQNGPIGAMAVAFARQREFGPEELPMLTTIGGQIAIALQNAEAYEKLDRMYLETVTALAAAMEAKDQYTASHAESLAAMALTVGRRMGMCDRDLRELHYAAVLHDIGKIGIPGHILNKPDKLTEDEFETMAQHTIIGERIISRIDYLLPIARVIRSAHERWDGRGYPDGIAGEAIPLAARVLLVCDAFDAMTTDRPYRRALSIETALQELRDNAGSQFDPKVVEAFLSSYPFLGSERAASEPAARRFDTLSLN